MTELAASRQRRIRKFYKEVSVQETNGLYALHLDGRPAKTPARADLAAPSRALAEAMAREWEGEGESVDFDGMRLTRLAATAIDLAAAQRGAWRDEIVSHARSDLVCYRAERPEGLAARQCAGWDRYLDWMQQSLGARLDVTSGVVAIEQPEAALAAIERKAASLDDWRLIGARQATALAGSAVLGLALEAGAFPPAEIFADSRLDERFQAEQWGVDAEAAAREARIEADFMATAEWLSLCP